MSGWYRIKVASTMVTHHTASLITANPLARSQSVARRSRPVVSRIAVMDQSSAPVSAGGSLALCRFHATRQRAEQNRACSRRGANDVPHCSQILVSAITSHVTRNGWLLPRAYSLAGYLAFIFRSCPGRLGFAWAL